MDMKSEANNLQMDAPPADGGCTTHEADEEQTADAHPADAPPDIDAVIDNKPIAHILYHKRDYDDLSPAIATKPIAINPLLDRDDSSNSKNNNN